VTAIVDREIDERRRAHRSRFALGFAATSARSFARALLTSCA
jgi:hypothetical protein